MTKYVLMWKDLEDGKPLWIEAGGWTEDLDLAARFTTKPNFFKPDLHMFVTVEDARVLLTLRNL